MKTNRIIFKTNPTFRKFVAIHEDKVNINNTIDAENTKTSNNDWVGVGRPRRIITLSSDDDHKYPLPSPDQTTSWNDGVNIWSPPSTAPSTAGHTSFGNLAFN